MRFFVDFSSNADRRRKLNFEKSLELEDLNSFKRMLMSNERFDVRNTL